MKKSKKFFIYLIFKKIENGIQLTLFELLKLIVDCGTIERADYSLRVCKKAARFPPEKYGHLMLVECSPEGASTEGCPNTSVMAYGLNSSRKFLSTCSV